MTRQYYSIYIQVFQYLYTPALSTRHPLKYIRRLLPEIMTEQDDLTKCPIAGG